MTEKDLQLIRDLIEGAISEFHCPPLRGRRVADHQADHEGLEHQRAHTPRDAPAG